MTGVRTDADARTGVIFPEVVGRPWLRSPLLPEPRVRSIPAALHQVVAAVPDRIAVDDGERRLTYSELLRATLAIARAVDANDPTGRAQVAVVVDQGIDGIATVLGVMCAGRVAIPLDAHDPVERLALVARQAQASLVLTHRSTTTIAEAISSGASIVELDDVVSEYEPASVDLPDVDPARLALVLFTSGSTGTPKGVVRDHDTLVRHGLVVTYANHIGGDDRVAITGSFGFVGAYVRVLGALFGGGTACPGHLRREGLRDLAAWVVAQRITVLQLVPSVLRALVDAAPDARMDSVKLVTLGGETLFSQDVRRARPWFGPRTVFQNRLGATEGASPAAWEVTEADDPHDGPLPVGRVEPWVDVRVVGDDGNEVRRRPARQARSRQRPSGAGLLARSAADGGVLLRTPRRSARVPLERHRPPACRRRARAPRTRRRPREGTRCDGQPE